jgi:uncharacterized membrane protein YdbT with pleckstrin-like domain
MTIDSTALDPGEKFLWLGEPDIHEYCKRGAARFEILVGALLLGIGATSFAYEYFQMESSWVPPALLFGAVFFLCKPFRMRREARRVRYALTDQRAIIETPGILLRNRVSIPFSEIRTVEATDGLVGDVLFRDVVTQSETGLDYQRDGFFAIEKPQEVKALLQLAMKKATGKSLAVLQND